MKKIVIFILILAICVMVMPKNKDLTVFGPIDFNDGIGRQSIGLIECLKANISINFLPSRHFNLKDINSDVQKILTSPFDKVGNVVIYQDLLSYFNKTAYHKIRGSKIKFAYSMFEATKISKDWVKKLNKYFDAVIVPDIFLISVYKNSGVLIPIFVLPLGIYLDEFLASKKEIASDNSTFVFGCTSRFYYRKNHKLLIQAFHEEFKDEKNIILRLSGGGQFYDIKTYESITNLIAILKNKNIILTNEDLAWKDYIKLLNSFDCYINLSLAEGFSIPSRESLASGIPCILSNNTGQQTICNTGFVYSVKSDILVPAYNTELNKKIGYFFNCKIDDVKNAMREVYTNYRMYKEKALASIEWVKQYTWPNLRDLYLNLVKPKKVLLGDKNIITNEYIMTNSIELYNKYTNLIND